MKEEIVRRTCDECNVTMEHSKDEFVNLSFNGWVTVVNERNSVLSQPKHWEFCSLACMMNYFRKYGEKDSG